MPQNQFHKGKGGRGSAAAGAGGSQEGGWKRAAGAFSGKAKRDYLKAKRAGKREGEEDDSEGEQGGGGGGGARAGPPAPAHASTPEVHAAVAAAQRGGGPAPPPDAAAVEAAAAARRGPRGRRPQAPMADADAPLRYAPFVPLPGDEPGTTAELPRCDARAVGFTREGRAVGMPMRPAWRGVARNAPQLNALEEAAFAAYVTRLVQQHGEARRAAARRPATPPPAAAAAAGLAALHARRRALGTPLQKTKPLALAMAAADKPSGAPAHPQTRCTPPG